MVFGVEFSLLINVMIATIKTMKSTQGGTDGNTHTKTYNFVNTLSNASLLRELMEKLNNLGLLNTYNYWAYLVESSPI